MKLKALFLFAGLLFLSSTILKAQILQDQVWESYQERMLQNDRNKNILLGWGLANILSGAVLYNSNVRDFGLMNASWGAINTGIALFAKRSAVSYTRENHTLAGILREEQKFNRIVALNTGLDLGYMGAGAAMMYLGEQSMIRQFGTSVLVQGSFLFIYDLLLLRESTKYLNQIRIYSDIMTTDNYIGQPIVAHAVTLRLPLR